MSFDTSRFIFDPWNDYSGVVMEQGRLQLDSDWNEWLAELARRIQAGTLDTLGRAVYPATTPFAFQITVTTDLSGANHVNIGPGRMYVDGLLAENHGAQSSAQWDPALAELSGSPQPPGTSPTGTIDYEAQPYYPNAPAIGQGALAGNGPFLAYLDVWKRPITYLEDPNLIDAAVNVDTTARVQTVWQVKLAAVPSGATCASVAANPPWPGPSLGQLTNNYAGAGSSGPCCLTSGTGYTGMENQFYRVEIHQPGIPATDNTYPLKGTGTATFKWSRDNGSVQTGVTGIQTVTNSLNNKAAQLTVLSLGRDQVLGFAPGNWIELIDDDLELDGQHGELHQIDSVDFSAKTITLVDMLQTPANFPVDGSNQTTPSRHTRITRWDQSGQIYQTTSTPGQNTLWIDLGATGATGDIPVPAPGTTLILENGISVTFGPNATTQFNIGDFWNFSARASTGLIDPLTNAYPRGIHHHYASLSIVSFSPNSFPDCRTKWPSPGETGCGCCTVTVGDGVDSVGQYTSIQTAINALPAAGGEVCILPGRYYENVFIQGLQDVVIHGCGWQTRVASAALAPGYKPPSPSSGGSSATTMNAVISIADSQHIELRGFAVEAATGEAGILLDGTGALIASPPAASSASKTAQPAATGVIYFDDVLGVLDATVEDIVLTASTLPALLAKRTGVLKVRAIRVAMANVQSLFPAVWMSGEEIEFVRNRVGLQTTANLNDWIPASVYADLQADAKNAGSSLQEGSDILHPGGIQIAGAADLVRVAENWIQGGLRNGVTLGSFTVLDDNGNDAGYTLGLTVALESEQTEQGTLLSPTSYPGLQGSKIVAGGLLSQISIDRNTIANFGLCGIGPVGFFDLSTILEVIAIEDLSITANTIVDTVGRATDNTLSSFLGYGAICLPTVEDLIVRDNVLTNWGLQPGLGVTGIFLLHGETVEISRNQIVDNRDWADASTPDQTGNPTETAGAISILMVTPPTLASDLRGLLALSIFEPGLPALRLEENLVRVSLGQALTVLGFGPFSISDNHFSCGGNIPGTAASVLQTVTIMNFGVAIELIAPSAPSNLAGQAATGSVGSVGFNSGPSFVSSSGAVMFTSNYCQLEVREVPQTSFASVMIISLDHLIFSNNHCWIDANVDTLGSGMTVDAFLLAGTLNVVSNRFQEAQNAVDLSALTIGLLNITSLNISTYCIWPLGAKVLYNNLSAANIIDPGICNVFNPKE